MTLTTQRLGTAMLDDMADRITTANVPIVLPALFDHLIYRRRRDPEAWPEFTRICFAHRLREQLHQDPLTSRAFTKPRGYSGDAVMMDYVYGLGQTAEAVSHASPLGRAIFESFHNCSAQRAVRYRKRLIANLIDRAASRGARKVLAVASGHLREAEISNAVLDNALDEFVAFDQDGASVEAVAREYTRFGVTTIQGSVRQLLSGKVRLGQYDLAYAAGLFDYLRESVARALMCSIFAMVRPGGKLLVPNFLPTTREIGYMEAFMDWQLIYRDHNAMYSLATTLPADEVADCECFNDPDDTIVFLLVSKKR